MILYRNHTGAHANDCTAHGLGPLQDAFAQLMDGAAPSTCFSLLTGGWLVVGLDTLSDDDQPSAGGGRVSPRELAWLQGVLRANAGTLALCVKVMTHRPVNFISDSV